MKNDLMKMAIRDAGILANKYELQPEFISDIIAGELKCSVDAYPFGCIYVNIDKEGNSPIASWVRSLETELDAYVYHCILTDSILSMLFVTEREHGGLFSPRCTAEYVGVAVVDMDSLDTGFAEIQLGKCGDVLVRIA